jgi:hypothetical protein
LGVCVLGGGGLRCCVLCSVLGSVSGSVFPGTGGGVVEGRALLPYINVFQSLIRWGLLGVGVSEGKWLGTLCLLGERGDVHRFVFGGALGRVSGSGV